MLFSQDILFGDGYASLSSHCLLFVLPSGVDGTRPVLLDQMGFGNCVVVNNTPANLEVIGDAGIWFDGQRGPKNPSVSVRTSYCVTRQL